jgi:hypothetical protein
MDVHVEDRLATLGSDVEYGTVSIFDATLAAYFRSGQVQASDQIGFFGLRFLQSAHVFLRDDQNVRWGLRLDVFKGERILVFVDFLGRNLAADDFAE